MYRYNHSSRPVLGLSLLIGLAGCAPEPARPTVGSTSPTGPTTLPESTTPPAGSAAGAFDLAWARDLPYFPTTVGDTWVTQIADSPTDLNTETVTDVREADNAKVITVAAVLKGGRPDIREEITVSDKGVFRRAVNVFDNRVKGDPVCLLQLPVKMGAKWDIHVRAVPGFLNERKGTSTVVAEEEVSVPIGKLKAVRVETEYSDNDGPTRKSTSWYARGVGQVKWERPNGQTVLKEFVRGRK
jgi:hypothetical protein